MNIRILIDSIMRQTTVFAVITIAALPLACSSPTPQSGTNTNWGSCASDEECAARRKGAICVNNACELPEASGAAPARVSSGRPDSGSHSAAGGRSDSGSHSDAGGRSDSGSHSDAGGRSDAGDRSDAMLPPLPLPGTGDSLASVAATDAGWIAVGTEKGNPYVVTSDDGLLWVPVVVPGLPGALTDVAFGYGTIVAVGSEPGQILTMPKGGAWRHRHSDAPASNVVYGNGKFLVGAGLERSLVSSDGLKWTPTLGAQWSGFVDGSFVLYNDEEVMGR